MVKVHLGIASEHQRSGYLNIDPIVNGGDVTNLDNVLCDAECDELIATDVIDFLPRNETISIIEHWCNKIRQGGEIVVGGIDIREVSKAVVNNEISLEDASLLLYGYQRAPFDYRKGTLTMQVVISILQSKGFKIIHKRISNYFYNVKAQR